MHVPVEVIADGDIPAAFWGVPYDAERFGVRDVAADANCHDMAEACKRVPRGVVCLLSALRFHGLTTQAPFEVWLAIDRKARLPRVEHPPLRVVRCPARALVEGVEEHALEGVPVRVTTPARTVVDCFAYRNKVGLDVALEALRDCRRRRWATMVELHQASRARRMANVMRPYLEGLGGGRPAPQRQLPAGRLLHRPGRAALDGSELAARLRQGGGWRPLLLVAVTALDDRRPAAFDTRLAKPKDPAKLSRAAPCRTGSSAGR